MEVASSSLLITHCRCHLPNRRPIQFLRKFGVRQLQWQSGLDYIYVATESSVSDNIVIITKVHVCVCARVCVMGGQQKHLTSS